MEAFHRPNTGVLRHTKRKGIYLNCTWQKNYTHGRCAFEHFYVYMYIKGRLYTVQL